MSEVQDTGAAAFDRRAIPKQAAEALWVAPDGHRIRLIDWPAPQSACRGSILFFPGRGDAYEKYLETLDHWRGKGWRVTAADWRGQAGSGRLGLDATTGHCDDFSLWVSDLADFWAAWKRETPAPHVLIGHSMGGHLVLRALAERRVDPDAVVLSAPMLGFAGKFLPAAVLHFVTRLMRAIGDPRRAAWKWSEKPGGMPEGRMALLTHDAQRYADELWWRENRPELAMGPASWGWLERAYASMHGLEKPGVLETVTTPILLIATSADELVDFGAIQRAASRLPHARLLSFGKEARHEILREVDEVRDRALAALDGFLDELVRPGK